jgi:hypothetical protein
MQERINLFQAQTTATAASAMDTPIPKRAAASISESASTSPPQPDQRRSKITDMAAQFGNIFIVPRSISQKSPETDIGNATVSIPEIAKRRPRAHTVRPPSAIRPLIDMSD